MPPEHTHPKDAVTFAILQFIQDYGAIYGFAPTLQEMAEAVSFAYASSVQRHLDKLEQWGYLERTPLIARGIKLTGKGINYHPYHHEGLHKTR